MLIELVDGGIKEIYTDTLCYAGCETCDYGSQFINEFAVILTGGRIEIELSKMYSYTLSEDYLMRLFLNNIENIKQLTELQFYEWLKKEINASNADEVTIETTLDKGDADNE
ncbi:hypothetical protein [Bacillus altitudinis]|uniref:hypothetical protein n=1 Tax=Bacillus altitudinis TaxID=293387 RepID=UPI002100F2C0|nr:hypothetical protein [Bacillus altitudinis]UTV34893.1 hypothetical protein NM966_19605 [Bacillus altitudinis]